jgi:hypothetical protein
MLACGSNAVLTMVSMRTPSIKLTLHATSPAPSHGEKTVAAGP